MNSYLVYRASFYLMLFVATMSLSGESPEGHFARFLGLIAAVAGAVAFYTVDRKQILMLPRQLANILAVGTLAVLYFEYRFDDSQRIPALAHWLVYLQLIKYFLPKTAEDDWFLFLLGLMQVLIGSVVNQSDQVGAWLFLWAMLAVWVLGQFFLQREAHRFSTLQSFGRAQGERPSREFATAPIDPYRGLFDLPYVASTARVMVTTIALGGLIFLVLPRQAGATRTQSGAPLARHLTGFDDEVQLGQLGEILENDSVVMTVEFENESGERIRPDEEPLWRGVTMLRYEGGRWHRQSKGAQSVVSFKFDSRLKEGKLIRQKIKLEPIDSPTLFGIRPILDASSVYQQIQPALNGNDGTLFRSDVLNEEYDYEVISDRSARGAQPHETPPSNNESALLFMPAGLKNKLRAIALPVIAKIDAEGPDGIAARARALESFLRDSGQFTYTLQMTIDDAKLDPVEDFLINRKAGHCEYFASALALLLRSVDIRSRLVNGFKGGDWNELTGTMNVRQKHAHSWVEAYAGLKGPERLPDWITLDPTPAAERSKSIAQVGGLAGNFRPLTDSIRHIWIFYVIGYDGDRQEKLIYGPMRMIATELRELYKRLGNWVRRSIEGLFLFRDINSFISIRGFFAVFIVGVLSIALVKLFLQLLGPLLRLMRGPTAGAASLSAGALFYRRFVQILAGIDLERTPTETQGEFALRAQKVLSAQGQQSDSVADVPREVVDAYYRIRFGHLQLEPESLEAINGRLDALEMRLKGT
jgi:protein-glutamine gamma-glutamyltransferase